MAVLLPEVFPATQFLLEKTEFAKNILISHVIWYTGRVEKYITDKRFILKIANKALTGRKYTDKSSTTGRSESIEIGTSN